MSKREQLMEYITQDIITFLVEDRQLDYTEAMRIFLHLKLTKKYWMRKLGYTWRAPRIFMKF